MCWEDFILNENVRQLSCQHVYHEICIRPWLELHGTCPICRQNLGVNEEQQNTENTNHNDMNSAGIIICYRLVTFTCNLNLDLGNALNAWQQLFQAVSNSGNSSSGSSTSGPDSTSFGSSSSNSDTV